MSATSNLKRPTQPGLAPIASVGDVRKVYPGGVEALSGIDLDFPEGQLTSLLGPSGCGKTTLLKIIAGLLPATSGTVIVDGRQVAGPGPKRRFRLSGLRADALGDGDAQCRLRPGTARRHKDEREAVAEKYIRLVGLQGFAEAYPHMLSGGMRQRVGLARALAVNAKVLLLDEPFSAVDEQTRRKFQEDLLELVAKERKTFLFITHSIEEAVNLSDRIVLLAPRPGRVTAIVEPDIPREAGPDGIRRDPAYLDTVERIWHGLKTYLD